MRCKFAVVCLMTGVLAGFHVAPALAQTHFDLTGTVT